MPASYTDRSEDTPGPERCRSSAWAPARSPPTAGTPELWSHWPDTPLWCLCIDTHAHRCISTNYLYTCTLTASQTDDEQLLQVIPQAIHTVDHGFPRWCHTAEKTGGSETPLYVLRAMLHLCATETNTDLRLPPSASTPRQILKAEAPLVVCKKRMTRYSPR